MMACLQGSLETQLQQDTLAFEQQLKSVNAELEQKEAELHKATDSFSKLHVDSEARNDQLSTDLRDAHSSIEALQADAKVAAQLREVRGIAACLQTCQTLCRNRTSSDMQCRCLLARARADTDGA